MGREVIPDEVRRFILTSISSVPYLEAILLLRSAPDQYWDVKKVAQRLYMPEKAAGRLLEELREANIVIGPASDVPGYRFQPESDELGKMIDLLAETYGRLLVPVTHLIHSKTSKKAQHFADAFKWRKD